jgi:hypothetical protein
MEHRIGKDQFARLDAQNIGQQPRFGGLGQPEDAGGNVDPGERDGGSEPPRMRASAIR